MTDHLKLTDEVLGEIEAAVWDMHGFYEHGRDITNAIRALRDAAEEVALRAGESTDPVPPYVQAAIDALAALLPDEPKGGG